MRSGRRGRLSAGSRLVRASGTILLALAAGGAVLAGFIAAAALVGYPNGCDASEAKVDGAFGPACLTAAAPRFNLH